MKLSIISARLGIAALVVAFGGAVAAAQEQTPRRLEGDDVVFMYAAADAATYRAYGATFLAWGGAHTRQRVQELRELGIHPTATMWCLTAGAKLLHENQAIREATVRDIAGEPIAVPWLFDHTYEGTPSWWGCTNNPVFKNHLREQVREVMSGGADGLHIDDHLGAAAPSLYAGGCFCDHCMKAFRSWLAQHSSPELLQKAGVDSFESFDFREFVKKTATTREEFLKKRHGIPLYEEFVDCQLQLAAENVSELGALAAELVGHPITLSANTGLPGLPHTVVARRLTHLVGEVDHQAEQGTESLINAVRAYRMAESIGKPIAATASGQDWAYVNEHKAENLVRIWIALGYACGQRLMAPNRMWCFSPEKGTHWYSGPVESYAPLYRFVREHPDLFRQTVTLGPLAPPAEVPQDLSTNKDRESLRKALDSGNPAPIPAGEKVWVFPRRDAAGDLVVHLVNLDYSKSDDQIRPAKNLEVVLPRKLVEGSPLTARLFSFEGEKAGTDIPVVLDQSTIRVSVPELKTWAVLRLSE